MMSKITIQDKQKIYRIVRQLAREIRVVHPKLSKGKSISLAKKQLIRGI